MTSYLDVLRSDLADTYSQAILKKYPHLDNELLRNELRNKIAAAEDKDVCLDCGKPMQECRARRNYPDICSKQYGRIGINNDEL